MLNVPEETQLTQAFALLAVHSSPPLCLDIVDCVGKVGLLDRLAVTATDQASGVSIMIN